MREAVLKNNRIGDYFRCCGQLVPFKLRPKGRRAVLQEIDRGKEWEEKAARNTIFGNTINEEQDNEGTSSRRLRRNRGKRRKKNYSL